MSRLRARPLRAFRPRLAESLEDRRVPAAMTVAGGWAAHHAVEAAALAPDAADVSDLSGGGSGSAVVGRGGAQRFSVATALAGGTQATGWLRTQGDTIQGRLLLRQARGGPVLVLNLTGSRPSGASDTTTLTYTAIGGTGAYRHATGSGTLLLTEQATNPRSPVARVPVSLTFNPAPLTTPATHSGVSANSAPPTEPASPITPVPTPTPTPVPTPTPTPVPTPTPPTDPPNPYTSYKTFYGPVLSGSIGASALTPDDPSLPTKVRGGTHTAFQDLGSFTVTGQIPNEGVHDYLTPGAQVGTLTLANEQGTISLSLHLNDGVYVITGGTGAYQGFSGSGTFGVQYGGPMLFIPGTDPDGPGIGSSILFYFGHAPIEVMPL